MFNLYDILAEYRKAAHFLAERAASSFKIAPYKISMLTANDDSSVCGTNFLGAMVVEGG